MRDYKIIAATAAVTLWAGAAQAADVKTIAVDETQLEIGTTTFLSGKSMHITIGAGSAAYRDETMPKGHFYSITDRGPNVPCDETEAMTGMTAAQACGGDEKAKFFPVRDFTPTIIEFAVKDGKATVVKKIPITGVSGKPITGLSNPLRATKTEGAFSSVGTPLGLDPSAIDSEGLVRMADGSFWVGEEYAPSLVHIAADGKVIERLVPKGVEKDLALADYPVKGALPAILMMRSLNRGIESVAASGDGKFLYFSVQSPLANPDAKAYKASTNVRLMKYDIAKGKAVGEWVYPLDDPKTFAVDAAIAKVKQNDVKVSEVTWLSGDRLLVLERISDTTKFYVVDLKDGATNIAGSKWDNVKTAPSLEQAADLAAVGVKPLGKEMLFHIDTVRGGPSKIEGIALDGDKAMYLINDNDFGIAGAKNEIIRVTLDKAFR